VAQGIFQPLVILKFPHPLKNKVMKAKTLMQNQVAAKKTGEDKELARLREKIVNDYIRYQNLQILRMMTFNGKHIKKAMGRHD